MQQMSKKLLLLKIISGGRAFSSETGYCISVPKYKLSFIYHIFVEENFRIYTRKSNKIKLE